MPDIVIEEWEPDLQIDTRHMLQAICEEADSESGQILQSLGVTPPKLQAVLLDLHTARQADAPQKAPHRSADWEQRIELQLTRIESELAAIRFKLTEPGSREAGSRQRDS